MRRLAAAVFSGVLLVSTIALAAPSEGERNRARSLAYEGQEALDRHDYATAAQRFEQADAIVHAPTLLLGLARARAGLGKLVSARTTYQRIVDEGVPARSPPPWFRAVEDAKTELAAIKQRIPSLLIQVTGAASPSVTLDGNAVNVAEPVLADPGRHEVRATADGVSPADVIVDLREGASTTAKLELHPVAAVDAPPPPPPPSTSSRKVAGYIVGGFGVAGLAVGGLMGVAAIGKHSTLEMECPDGRCQTAKAGDDLTSYHNVGLLSTIGFIGGGALVGLGVVLIVTAPKAPPPSDAASPSRAAVAISMGPNGVSCLGRF